MTKNEKIVRRFKRKYFFVYREQNLKTLLANHFDKKGNFITFTIGLLQNQTDFKSTHKLIKINKEEWINLFLNLYQNTQIIELFKRLEFNPIVPLEQTINQFSCFDEFINNLFLIIKQHQIQLNITENELKIMFKNVFGYLLYNHIPCKIPYDLDQIIVDADYDTKQTIVLNNTKLFSLAKQSILDNCGKKINNLIVLLLGMNNSLSA